MCVRACVCVRAYVCAAQRVSLESVGNSRNGEEQIPTEILLTPASTNIEALVLETVQRGIEAVEVPFRSRRAQMPAIFQIFTWFFKTWSVCLSVGRSVGLSVCQSVGRSVCRSVGR